MNAGALGAEIVLGGKLPGARAKSWRFSQGYLKKVGDSAKVVDRAKSRAETRPGTVGIKVSILSPYAVLRDKIDITKDVVERLKMNVAELKEVKEEEKPKKKSRKKIK